MTFPFRQWTETCSGFIPHEYTDTKGVKHPKATWAHQEYGILNGLFMVDLDHVEDPRQLWQDITAQEVWEKEYKARTFLAFVTCSNHGLKIVMACNVEEGNLASCQNRFCQTFGLPNDKSTKNSNRLSFAPCRADVLYYAPEQSESVWWTRVAHNTGNFARRLGNLSADSML